MSAINHCLDDMADFPKVVTMDPGKKQAIPFLLMFSSDHMTSTGVNSNT